MTWLTLGEYARLHGASMSAVLRRLAKGLIPRAHKIKVLGQPTEVWQIPADAPYPRLPLGRPRSTSTPT